MTLTGLQADRPEGPAMSRGRPALSAKLGKPWHSPVPTRLSGELWRCRGSYWSLRERQMFETIFTTFVAKRKPCGNERVLYWTQATFPSKSSTIQSPAELHAPGGSPSPGGPARGGKSPRPAHGSPSPQPSQLPRPPVAAPASLSGLWTAGSVEPRAGGPGP